MKVKNTSNRIGIICEKTPVVASEGMVVTNHPCASSAGIQVLSSGGNAVDAAIASLFALTVVEPMMVGVLGGGIIHLREPSGVHVIIDGLSTAPSQANFTMFAPLKDGLSSERSVVGSLNDLGALAVAVPGALLAWSEAIEKYGNLRLQDVLAPSIQLAEAGFLVTPYLSKCIFENAQRLLKDEGLKSTFLPNGEPLQPGAKFRRPDYAGTLRRLRDEGPNVLYSGELGEKLVTHLQQLGGILTKRDLTEYKTIARSAISSGYRGHQIFGPPPPASSGIHIAQMLNILEGFDLASFGFGSKQSIHYMAEAMKIAFADRSRSTADPAFFDVPIDTIISKKYAEKRREKINESQAQSWVDGVSTFYESNETTHVTCADNSGLVVSATQTINGLFGSCLSVPGTGLIANNYMLNFDPHPHRALSIEPGKRVFTSMAPMMIEKNGAIKAALGLPGALRIFPSAMQAIVNLIDYEMDVQSAVEAPRIWTEGGILEIEEGISEDVYRGLLEMGHQVERVPRIAGGMNAITFEADGSMKGAACWRADGVPIGIGGGLARDGVTFSTN